MKTSFPVLHRFARASRSAAVLASCFVAATAFAGSPHVTYMYPAGAQRGGEITVTCAGQSLEDAKEFLFDEPGFTSEIVDTEKNTFHAKIKVAPDVRLGEHTYRVITKSGVADLRLFYVSPFPMVAEADSKVQPKPAQHIDLNTTVYGHTPDDARASYEVDLKKGQRLSIEVIGLRLHTEVVYDPRVTITQDGTVIADVDDCSLTRQDPVASIVAPQDGKYIITVRDTSNAGTGPCSYLMNVGTFARPLAVYPAGGPAGQDLKVTLLGDATGPIEETIKLPAKATDEYRLYTTQDQPTPQSNVMRVSDFPN
ncbi:MAG TPA: PPC domain-containing protein, partial [Bryobacteraceae bacterium]